MGMHDHTPIRLPGGTVTSGADLANRGISENQYPSVAEMEISIQDGFKSYGQAYVPPPPVTYQLVLKKAKLSFRLRTLSICGFAFAFFGFLHGNPVIFGAYGLIFSLIMLFAFAFYPYLKRPEPWGNQEASDYSKARGATKVIIGGMVFIKYFLKLQDSLFPSPLLYLRAWLPCLFQIQPIFLQLQL